MTQMALPWNFEFKTEINNLKSSKHILRNGNIPSQMLIRSSVMAFHAFIVPQQQLSTLQASSSTTKLSQRSPQLTITQTTNPSRQDMKQNTQQSGWLQVSSNKTFVATSKTLSELFGLTVNDVKSPKRYLHRPPALSPSSSLVNYYYQFVSDETKSTPTPTRTATKFLCVPQCRALVAGGWCQSKQATLCERPQIFKWSG